MEFSFAGEDIYSTDSDDVFVHDKSLGASLLEELDSLTFFEDVPSENKTKKSSLRRQPGGEILDDSDSSSDIFDNVCHSSDIDVWIAQLKKKKFLALRQVEKLCSMAKDVLSKESNVVELSSPITVCGDIHGQHYDLLELFKIAGEPPDVNYLFMGDYVDRGRYSVAVVSLLLALKIKYPKRITLLRGNHESRQTTQVYGFYDECFSLYGNSLAWTLFMGAFDYLPLCALVDDNHLCMHGGLSPSFGTIDQIRTLLRFGEIPHEGPICDIVWSDPADKKDALGFQNSPRGAGCTWGKDVSAYFTTTNGVETVTRAHQLVNKGIDWCHNDKIVTVFSAPNYCYRSGNLAGYIMMDGQENIAYTFEAAPRQNFPPPPPRFSNFKSYFF